MRRRACEPTYQRRPGGGLGKPLVVPPAREVRDERRADGRRRLAPCVAATTRAAVGGYERDTGAAVGGCLSPVARDTASAGECLGGLRVQPVQRPPRPEREP